MVRVRTFPYPMNSPLDLTHAPLLHDLLDLDFGLGPVPEALHTAYTTRVFVDDGSGLALILRRHADGAEISLIFEDAVLLESAGKFAPGATPDGFYRGRYVVEGALTEQHGTRTFFYLDFVDDEFSVVLAAARVTAEFSPAPV